MFIYSSEYRFPIKDEINCRFLDNIFNLNSLSGVIFFDIGKSWFGSFHSADFKKDAGLGLRFNIDLISFLEKVVVRLDIAQAIDEPKKNPQVWLGISHAF